MKKIPTLFVRKFENHKIVDILDEITPGCEEAFKEGAATVKYDGSCCAIINGEFYKRYDCKKGKTPPEGAIPCCDPDPVTGHWPHWVKVGDGPEDKWFREALKNFKELHGGLQKLSDNTFEAVGPHFQGNPYNYEQDTLIIHGCNEFPLHPRTFERVKQVLTRYDIEGIVFWLNGEPVCKIKRSDFGLPWPVKKGGDRS